MARAKPAKPAAKAGKAPKPLKAKAAPATSKATKGGAGKAVARKPAVKAAAAKAGPKIAAKVAAKVAAGKPAATRPGAGKPSVGKPAAKAVAAKVAPTAAPAPVPARFGFEAQPLVRTAAALTPLVRAQLVWDARLSVGKVTPPERIPASYFAVGIVRWRVTEKGKALFDVVQNTAFLAGTDEPAGLERRAGLWVATGRGAVRALAMDLVATAWELNRDWPGRRLPLPPEPKRGSKLEPEPLADGEPFPPDTAFV